MKLSQEIRDWHRAEYIRNLPCEHLTCTGVDDDWVVARTAFSFIRYDGDPKVICNRCLRTYRGEKAAEIMKVYGIRPSDLFDIG